MDTVGTETNKLFLDGDRLYQRQRSDKLKLVDNVFCNDNRLIHVNGRFYRETKSRYLIQERGVRPQGCPTRPKNHPRIITWYGSQGLVYKKTKAGGIKVEGDLVRCSQCIHQIPCYLLKLKEDEVEEEEEPNEDKETEEEEKEEADKNEDSTAGEEEGDKEDTNKENDSTVSYSQWLT